MNSDLQYIVTFIKVIEFGSFSQAAEELGVSKSVVSKHVSALESLLKTQLLKRTTRKLVLTDTGQTYYQQIKNIPEQLTNAQQTLQPYSEKPHGVLKVIAPENFYNAIRETVVPQFLLQNPEVSLQLQFVRPAKNYINDDFDIIILWKYGHLNFPDYNLIPFGIYSMPIQLYATPGYLKKHGTPKTPQDLLQHNCFASVQEAWPFKKKTEDLFHINIKPSLITKNDIIIHGAVVADVGIAYAYPRLFADDLKSGKVVQVLPEYTPLTIDFYAFYHPSPFQPLKIKAFLEQLKQLR